MQYHNTQVPMQQMPPLQFSAEFPNQMGIQMIDPNNPPFVPQLQIEQWLMPWVRFGAGIAAQIIVQEGRKQPAHALRIFMYNQFTANNFMNQSFDNLVSNVMNLVAYWIIIERKYTADENGIQLAILESARVLCELTAVDNVRHNPGLQNYLTAQEAQTANNLVALFDDFGRKIGQLINHRRGAAAQAGHVQQGMYPNPTINPQQVHTNPALMQPGFSQSQSQRYQGTYDPRNQPVVYNPPVMHPGFQNGYGQSNPGLTGGTSVAGLFQHTPAHQPMTQQPQQQSGQSAWDEAYGDRWGSNSTQAKVVEEFAPTPQPTAQPTGSYGRPVTTWDNASAEVPSAQPVASAPAQAAPQPTPASANGKKMKQEAKPVNRDGIIYMLRDDFDYDGYDFSSPIPGDDVAVVIDQYFEEKDKIVWIRSDRYPFLPMPNPFSQILIYVILKSGIVVPRIFTVENKEVMDYTLHDARMSILPKEFTFQDSELRQMTIERTVANPEVTTVELASETPFELPEQFAPVVVKDETIAQNLDSLWDFHKTDQINLETEAGKKIPVFSTTGTVVKTFYNTTGSEVKLIEDLNDAGSFEEAHRILVEAANSVTREFWLAVEGSLTKATNEVMNRRIGLTGLSISSFYEDGAEIGSYIKTNFGVSSYLDFCASLSIVVGRAVTSYSDEDTADFVKVVGSTNDMVDRAFAVSKYNLTSLDCLAEEIGFKPATARVSQVILKEANPLLFAILEAVFKQASASNAERKLLRTSDGVVFEANQVSKNGTYFTLALA